MRILQFIYEQIANTYRRCEDKLRYVQLLHQNQEQRTNQTNLMDKSRIQKQKQKLDQRIRLYYKVTTERNTQVRIDVT